MSWLNCKDGPSRRSKTHGPPLSVFFWIRYRRFLDTQGEGRRTCYVKKGQSETGRPGKERFRGARSEQTICNKTKRRGFEEEARQRIRHSHTQCKKNQSVFGIVPGLNCVIPVVENLDEGAYKASEQHKRDSYKGRPRSHRTNYITLY